MEIIFVILGLAIFLIACGKAWDSITSLWDDV